MNYYKIVNNNYISGFKYQTGLNIYPHLFNRSNEYDVGGIFFSREDILAFLWAGPWIRKVKFPSNMRIYELTNMKKPESTRMWKADKIILGKPQFITTDILQQLINEGANVQAGENNALCWAAKNGHIDITKLFLDNGADIHSGGDKAFWWAAYKGHNDVIELLIKYGANIHIHEDYALRWAAHNGHIEVVKILLNVGADKKASYYEALRFAYENNHIEVVELLTQ